MDSLAACRPMLDARRAGLVRDFGPDIIRVDVNGRITNVIDWEAAKTVSSRETGGESRDEQGYGFMVLETTAFHQSRAAAQLTALTSPARLSLLTAVATHERNGGDRSLTAIATALGLTVKALLKEAVRLQEAGLLTMRGQVLSTNLTALRGTADVLVQDLPMTRLLRSEPELERFFKQGRLVDLPDKPDVLERIGRLLVQLLPTDRVLTEAEVDRRLAEVHDDHAALRRLLVGLRLVTRDAGSDYRRSA
ncbi:DUF2087 domain-containing protein [Actinomadura spongiicola]|nr:DUF2087 domain-containing protein [Actinomadura spongiicola]